MFVQPGPAHSKDFSVQRSDKLWISLESLAGKINRSALKVVEKYYNCKLDTYRTQSNGVENIN